MPEYTELQRLESRAQGLGEAIGSVLEQHAREYPEDARIGFVLWLCTMNSAPGWGTYISNAQRDDIIIQLEDLVYRLKEARRNEQSGRPPT